MKRWLIRLVLSAIALVFTCLILANVFPPGLSGMTLNSKHPELAVLAVFCLSVVNSLVRPVLGLLCLPLNLLTLGAAGLLINSLLFWATGFLTGGYEVKGVVGILIGPILMGCLTAILNMLVRD